MLQTKTQQLGSASVKTSADRPQVFTVWSDKVKGRIDPHFYIFNELKIKNLTSIKEFAKIQGGYAFKSSEYKNDNGIPLVRIQNIQNGEINLSDTVYIDEKYFKTCERFLLEENDILIAMTGATIGKVGRINKNNLPAFLNQRVGKFVVDKTKINSDYLFYIFQFDIFTDQIKKLSLGGSQPNISPGSIENIQIPLPPLSTQNKIVEIMAKAYQEKKEKEAESGRLLESIDTYVLGQLGIKAPEVKRDMVFEVMSNKVENNRVDAEYWQPFLGNIEQTIKQSKHKTKKLKDFITKIHYGASTSNAYVDSGIPLLRILNIKPNYVNLSDVVYLPEDFRKELGTAFVKAGDLLISRSGTVGVVSVVPKEVDSFAFGSFMIKFCLNDEIDKEFISIWLNNKLNKLLTEREKIGAIQGNITIGTIENFDIPVPPLAIQNKIVEKINSYYSQAKKLKDEANHNLQKAKERVGQIILG